jgi:drug/metabolite transporter (DMT)-like permease
MIFCSFIAMAVVLIEGSQGLFCVDSGMLAVCAVSGITNAALLVGWILAVRKNPMVTMDVGTTLGSIIPAVLCAFLFGEAISIPKMIGFALIVLATAILAVRGNNRQKGTLSGMLLLIFTLVCDGLTAHPFMKLSASASFRDVSAGVCEHAANAIAAIGEE